MPSLAAMSDETSQHPLGQESGEPFRSEIIKAFIERDYTDSTKVRFYESCPVRILPLVHVLICLMPHIFFKVNAKVVVNTVMQINTILEELTKFGGIKQILENVASTLSLYLVNPSLPHRSKDCLHKLTAFIERENELVYNPLGLHLNNPIEQGLLQMFFHVIPRPLK